MKKASNIIIFGVGETARLAYEYFAEQNIKVTGFVVNAEYITSNTFLGLPVISSEDLEKKYPPSEYKIFVAIAGGQLNYSRRRVFEYIKSKEYATISCISSKAIIGANTKIGENCFIMENVVIQSGASLGDDIIIWPNVYVSHLSKIDNHCYIAAGVTLGGNIIVGQNSYLGIGCSIADGIEIAEDNFITMGTVVRKSTHANKLYEGNPAVENKFISAKQFCGVK